VTIHKNNKQSNYSRVIIIIMIVIIIQVIPCW